MLAAALLAFLHHLAAFLMVAVLVLEWVTFRSEMTTLEARRIQIADMVYGICASVVLVVGALRVMYFEKGWQYYLGNHAFLTKMLLFLIAGLVSIYPTVRFIKWGKVMENPGMVKIAEREAGRIARCINIELTCIIGMLLMAALMARGVS
ncbi:MAG: DUF2214 family protein [Proteobacteria bacterium]|nr:DUF2214 family protein [Pseudomonadota bacterium]